MGNYQFTVELVEVEAEKLSLEVSVRCPFNPKVKNPKIAVIFDSGKQTRRLPLLLCAYDKLEDGTCYMYAKYTYDIDFLFFQEHLGKKVVLWFSLIYGEDEVIHEPFCLGSEEQMKKHPKSTRKGMQKYGEVMPYRIVYPEKQNEVWLVSDMDPLVENRRYHFMQGLRERVCGIWQIFQLMISVILLPIFLIDGLLAVWGCVPKKKVIENKGLVYILKHARWRMDNFSKVRVGFLAMKLWGMHLMNWIGRHKKIKKNQVVFLSNRRGDLTGNFEFIYNILKKDDNLDIRFVLDANETKQISLIHFLQIGYYFGCSKVVLVDDFLELLFMMPRRKGTTLMQLWHACGAFKTFGYTRLGKEGGQRQDSPNHRNYDYATVSSKEIAKFYAEGFGLSLEKVVATGVPRTDVFFDQEYRKNVTAAFYEKYPKLREKKILLFAPTFRGNGKNSGYYSVEQFDVNSLYEQLNGEYAIVIKHHPFVKSRNKIKKEYQDYIIDMSANSELNDLLFVTDLLITDYSSVVFEASLLNIPMLFYVYDLNQYIATRGFYYEYETFVPGKIVYDFGEIAPAIQSGDLHEEKLEPFKRRFFDGLDGKSSERTVQLIYQSLEK